MIHVVRKKFAIRIRMEECTTACVVDSPRLARRSRFRILVTAYDGDDHAEENGFEYSADVILELEPFPNIGDI
jgi:hypothetical protein